MAIRPKPSAPTVCVKRDGRRVPFDQDRISRAIRLCFGAVGWPPGPHTGEPLVRGITEAVVAYLSLPPSVAPDVETVQRAVIRELWSRSLFDAAEHYQNYRERHRAARNTRPVTPDVQARFDEMGRHFPSDLQIYQFMSKFARWRDEDKRRETWAEACDRVTSWLFGLPGVLTSHERVELWATMYALEASPAMRVVQMAGPALERCNVGAYNCAYLPLADIRSFAELLYILMQGTGVGFSCESEYVSQLPRVKKQNGKTQKIAVPDTTEGWCDAFRIHLEALWDGWDTDLDVSAVRPKNARLKTKGGRASGPGPFLDLIAFSRNLIKSRQGRFLEDTDAHRLACMAGKIVQVGGVRRAAEISLSDLDSVGMRNIKSGAYFTDGAGVWTDGKYLSMANNSAVYDFDGDVPSTLFMEEWLALAKSGTGERGIFNRRAALKHSPPRRVWGGHRPGVNPCAEILLRPYEFCNLSIAVARPDDTPETLRRKVRAAAYFGKIQSLATRFNYIRPDWKKNCEEERLLGVDITGHADCPLLVSPSPERTCLLRELQDVVHRVDVELSARWGTNRSAAATTVKPSGDSAVFFDSGSGVSPRFAAHQIRWVREKKGTPVARFLADSGVPHADAPEAPEELQVFGFPKAAPPGALLRDDVTALQQLENWLDWKINWAEHSVSATIYVEPHEWPEVGAWVYKHLDQITGLSFLPKDNGRYTYAPNEEITAAQYAEMTATFPKLDWAKLTHYEADDETGARATMACVGGSCD